MHSPESREPQIFYSCNRVAYFIITQLGVLKIVTAVEGTLSPY